MVYGPVPSNIITWLEPLISSSIKTVFIKALTIQDVQDQLMLVISVEEFTTPTNRRQLLKKIKEKGIQDIMDNTTVDPIKNQVCVKYLYKPNLPTSGRIITAPPREVHPTAD